MLIYLAMIEGPEERSKFEQIYEKYRALMFYRAKQILGDDRWTEGNFVYTLSGTIPMEELKLIAEGIQTAV